MSNYINYILHRTIDPVYYHRQYENDLPLQKDKSNWLETSQRIVLIVVPFLSLHKPAGQLISTVMGSCRIMTSFTGAVQAGYNRKAGLCLAQMGLMAWAIFSVASSLLHYRLGLLATTSVDIFQNFQGFQKHLAEKKYSLAAEDLMLAGTSGLYLAMMVTASLEIALLSVVAQVALNGYQSRKEWKEGKRPEALAKFAMGCIRAREGKIQWDLIQRRNELLSNPLLRELFGMVQTGRKVEHLIDNPLNDLNGKAGEKRVVMQDATGQSFDFGAHFHGHGKGLVKGGNLTFREKDGQLELDFKITHVYRERLEKVISQISTTSKLQQMNELLALSHSHVRGIKVQTGRFEIGGVDTKAYKISFEGIGSVRVGAEREMVGLYNRVVIKLEKESNIYQLHELLTFLDLQGALCLFTPDDLERLKLGSLFRIFFPIEATRLERSPEYFDLSIVELKAKMIERAPPMKELFDRYLSRIEPYEILPGRIRYRIAGLSEDAYRLGARALMHSVMTWNENELFPRLASILSMGILSSETRFASQLNIEGLSSDFDFVTGGADSVFTQLLTEKNIAEKTPLNDFAYFSDVALLISLDALETGTYQYHWDSFGSREEDYGYMQRPSLPDFIAEENESFYSSNEVMVKERIDPSMIQRIVFADANQKFRFMEYLKGLWGASYDQAYLDKFLITASSVTAALFKTPKDKDLSPKTIFGTVEA